MDEPRKIFGKNLKYIRKIRGVSQRSLGTLIWSDPVVAIHRISRYENGERLPRDLKDLVALAGALDVPVAYFFADDPLFGEIIRMAGNMTQEQKKDIVASWRDMELG